MTPSPGQTRFSRPGEKRQTSLEEALGEAPPPETGLVAAAREEGRRMYAELHRTGELQVPTRLEQFEEGAAPPEQVEVQQVPRPAPPQRKLVESEAPAPVPRTFHVTRIPASEVEGWHLPHPPRDYQVASLDRFLDQQKGSVILATGMGKTDIGIGAINALRVPAVVIVPTRILVDQWVRNLHAAGIDAGVYYGDEKRPSYVTVSTYQSLFDAPEIIREFPLIIFDEGDMATSDQFRKLIEETTQHPYALLLTATPPSDPVRKRLQEEVLPTLYIKTSKEGIESGALVEPVVDPIRVGLTGQEQKDYDKATKAVLFAGTRIGGQSPRLAARLTKSGDPELRAAAFQFLKAFNARRKILAEASAKFPALQTVVEKHPGEKVLLFSESTEALDKACGYLSQHGIPCRIIIGDTDPRSRRRNLEEWGVEFQVLGSVKVLERGVDVPTVAVGVILASGSGRTQLTQRIGRIVRPSPGKNAAYIYVILAGGTVEENMLKVVLRLTGQSPDGPPVHEDVPEE